MLKFKQFLIQEEAPPVEGGTVDADDNILKQVELINAELDKSTDITFTTSVVFVDTVRQILERYGVLLPGEINRYAMNSALELVYKLGASDMHLYMVWNLNDYGWTEGYAQVVDSSELNALKGMDDDEWMKNEPIITKKTPYAAKDDDSGDTSEY